MATDDRDDFDDRPRRRRDPETLVRDARSRLATPATLLILSAVFMLLWQLGWAGVVGSGYDAGLAISQWAADMQPPGPQKDQLQKQVQEMQGRDRTPEYVQFAVLSAIGLTLDVVILVGALRMKGVRSYGLALAAAICSIVPLNSCCCLGLPFGIWALIVLLNPDVKAAFAANRSAGGSPDVLDPGFGPDR